MTSSEIRQQFLDFFESKKHRIVASAPIVNKDDPTLMFINAGMNPFKDYFLGNKKAENTRITDTQKCLRVSGKHNDLEEVGVDSYHHTMFEMLGNWSFGDYFKQEAIEWAWELLTEVYKLDKDRIYVTVFEGDKKDNLLPDLEAVEFWKHKIDEDRILFFDKKDNFWEMGETGPCGPCSEIHVDLRSDEERKQKDGRTLVNMDDPLVVEIWNLVFIQYNRKADRSLEPLPSKHIDTGMGFERLCMAMQGKTSNYDTDVFTPFIELIEKKVGIKYTFDYALDAKTDIAMRVVADHIRAVAFTIADGQMPSNTGAGYVIRRILRRAVRYYYSILNYKQPLLHQLIPLLAENFKSVFPELDAQKDFVKKVILAEEDSFLKTLEDGLKRLENIKAKDGIIDGQTAFELYDTYGFPIDLTRLIVSEQGLKVDEKGFEQALEAQKARSRKDAVKQVGDWTILEDDTDISFVGYDDDCVAATKVLKYRTVKVKKGNQFQLVLKSTPFYPEGGGQVGDSGLLWFGEEKVVVLDTKKENDLVIHIVKNIPNNIDSPVRAEINASKRRLTENNHSATHLLHSALREVLGTHVQQKGSFLNDKMLRFDFAHFQKVTTEEVAQIETIVNKKIRENIPLKENRTMAIADAKAAGATMLFGEKYGDSVRMITFDDTYSMELCGGCHVSSTGKIGLLKITTETAVSAGVRRIEAMTADGAEAYLNKELGELNNVRGLFKNAKNLVNTVEKLQEDNKQLQKEVEKLLQAQANNLKDSLKNQFTEKNGVQFLAAKLPIGDAKAIKNLAYQLEKERGNVFIVFASVNKEKPMLTVVVSENITKEKELHAGNIVRNLAKNIQGGGGGQAFFATAGGKNADGIEAALKAAEDLV